MLYIIICLMFVIVLILSGDLLYYLDIHLVCMVCTVNNNIIARLSV